MNKSDGFDMGGVEIMTKENWRIKKLEAIVEDLKFEITKLQAMNKAYENSLRIVTEASCESP